MDSAKENLHETVYIKCEHKTKTTAFYSMHVKIYPDWLVENLFRIYLICEILKPGTLPLVSQRGIAVIICWLKIP